MLKPRHLKLVQYHSKHVNSVQKTLTLVFVSILSYSLLSHSSPCRRRRRGLLRWRGFSGRSSNGPREPSAAKQTNKQMPPPPYTTPRSFYCPLVHDTFCNLGLIQNLISIQIRNESRSEFSLRSSAVHRQHHSHLDHQVFVPVSSDLLHIF
jgi:hypothetical protein